MAGPSHDRRSYSLGYSLGGYQALSVLGANVGLSFQQWPAGAIEQFVQVARTLAGGGPTIDEVSLRHLIELVPVLGVDLPPETHSEFIQQVLTQGGISVQSEGRIPAGSEDPEGAVQRFAAEWDANDRMAVTDPAEGTDPPRPIFDPPDVEEADSGSFGAAHDERADAREDASHDSSGPPEASEPGEISGVYAWLSRVSSHDGDGPPEPDEPGENSGIAPWLSSRRRRAPSPGSGLHSTIEPSSAPVGHSLAMPGAGPAVSDESSASRPPERRLLARLDRYSSALAAAPNSAWLVASGSPDEDGGHCLQIWSPRSGMPVQPIDGYASSLLFSPNNEWLAAAAGDKVRVWDPGSGRLLTILGGHGFGSNVWTLAASSDGALLAGGSRDGRIRIWDVKAGRLRHTLIGHRRPVTALAAIAGGTLLASGGADGTVRVWDVQTGRIARTLESANPLAVALALDKSGYLRGPLFHTPWQLYRRASDISHHKVRQLVGAADGSWLARVNDLQTSVWDLRTSKELVSLSGGGRLFGGIGGDRLAFVNKKSARILEARTGRAIHEIRLSCVSECESAAPANLEWLAVTRDTEIWIWDLGPDACQNKSDGDPTYVLEAGGKVSQLVAAPDGSWLVGLAEDGRLLAWDIPPQ